MHMFRVATRGHGIPSVEIMADYVTVYKDRYVFSLNGEDVREVRGVVEAMWSVDEYGNVLLY